MDLYRELIIQLYKNPANKRVMEDATVTHSGANITCGDHVRMYVKLSADKKTVADLSFEGQGCAISMASASILTEEAKDKTIPDVAALKLADIEEWLGTELGPSRAKCGILALETLQAALNFSNKDSVRL